MFGYIDIDYESLAPKYKLQYKGLYCGLCKTLGRNFGQLSRLVVNNDITFLYSMICSYYQYPIDIKKESCVYHPLVKRYFAYADSEILIRVCAISILLFYYKINDDIFEKNGIIKKKIRKIAESAYQKAKKYCPNLDNNLKMRLSDIQNAEKKCATISELLKLNGALTEDIMQECLIENDLNMLGLMNCLGQIIYLFDAIDDLEKDKKKSNFNPLINEFSNFTTKKEFIEKNINEINALFAEIYGKLINYYNNVKDENSNPIIDNVLLIFLPKKFKSLLV